MMADNALGSDYLQRLTLLPGAPKSEDRISLQSNRSNAAAQMTPMLQGRASTMKMLMRNRSVEAALAGRHHHVFCTMTMRLVRAAMSLRTAKAWQAGEPPSCLHPVHTLR
jgi:hypothetical protein